MCEQLAQGSYVNRSSWDSNVWRCKSDALTTTPPRHTKISNGLTCWKNLAILVTECLATGARLDHKRWSEAKVENLRDSSCKKNWGMTRRDRRRNVNILKELQMEKNMWNFTDTLTDLFWTRVSLGKEHTYMHRYTHGHRTSWRRRKRWLDNIREDCEDLNLTVHQAYHLAKDRITWRNIVRNMGFRSALTSSSSQKL